MTGVIAQDCLHLLVRHEPAMFDVMNEAQRFDVLLKATRYVLSIAPEARPNKFMRDPPQHGVNFGQLFLRLGRGAVRKDTVVV